MSRAIAILLVLPLATTAAPAPKGKSPTVYHATRVGDTLVYESRLPGRVTERTVTVQKVEEQAGTYTVTATVSDGGTAKAQVSAAGVVLLPTREPGTLNVPVTLLRLPARAGDTWEWEEKDSGSTTYLGEEEVEVPAGKFKTRRVAVSVTRDVILTVWLAQGVGAVKMDGGAAGTALILKSFTPGK